MNDKKSECGTPKKNDTQDKAQVKSLDDLLDFLNQDDLRHVVGGRPKGQPSTA